VESIVVDAVRASWASRLGSACSGELLLLLLSIDELSEPRLLLLLWCRWERATQVVHCSDKCWTGVDGCGIDMKMIEASILNLKDGDSSLGVD
jgi:hypothetical protein